MTREAALLKEVKAFELQRQEVEQEAELRRKKQEEVHQGELAEKDKDIKFLQLKEMEANLALEEIRKELLAEQEKVRALREKSELDDRRVAECRAPTPELYREAM